MSSSESSRQKSVLTFLIPATFLFGAGVTYLVHKTGGTPSIYANLILIPIVLTALFSPVWYSALFAALSGIAMGPLITYLNDGDTSSWTWLIRALIYVAVSIVISFISARSRKRERHFEHLATHDPLTDLPNFSYITSSKIPSSGALSILMLAFNEDSDIQGLFGSDFYSSIVKNISSELKEILSSYPNATLCKRNNLNYAILVNHYSNEESLESILAALNNINDVTITIEGIPVYVSYRIGFTVIRPGSSISEGLRQANIALRYSFLEDQQISRYTDAMRDYYKGTVSIASEFSSAITKGMVQASYQTIHKAGSHEPAGVEILAKWLRDDGTRMTAEEFVPILEKTSCLQKLTMFMTEEAIRYAKLPVNEGKKFSINFSASELSERSVMEFVRSVEGSGIDTSRIQVEITGAFAEDAFLVRDNLLFLRKHGIQIAIDYLSAVSSSFILVSDTPVDIIKINRSITNHIDQPRGAEMVRSIIRFAKAAGILTVAEGIENESQVTFFEKAGVDYLQGYFFSVPKLLRAEEPSSSSASSSGPSGEAASSADEKPEKNSSAPIITIVSRDGKDQQPETEADEENDNEKEQ